MQQPYHLNDTACPHCRSTGPFLLDSEDDFEYRDGALTFPSGEWGIDIDCDCPACGFGGRFEDFLEWVEVTGEAREEVVREFRKRHEPFLAAMKQAQRNSFERIIASLDTLVPEAAVIELLFESMHWADRHGHSFSELLRLATRQYRNDMRQEGGGA